MMAANDSCIDPVPNMMNVMMYEIIARRMVLRLPIHCNNMHAINAAGMAPIGGELAEIKILTIQKGLFLILDPVFTL